MADIADMLVGDMYDPYWVGEYDEPDRGWIPKQKKTCKLCGKYGLKWGRHQGKWRLFEETQIHTCDEYRLALAACLFDDNSTSATTDEE